MFHVHAFNPHPLLRHCVDSYLIATIDQADVHCIDRTFLPSTKQNLVIGLDKGNTVYDCNQFEYSADHFFAGPYDRICHVMLFPGMKKMIVHFKPGGLFKIFHIPASTFLNRSVDALEFLGKQLLDFSQRLGETHLSNKIELMDAFLIRQMQNQNKKSRNIDEAIRLIDLNKGNIGLRQLEQFTFTTKRTLERHFLEQVGLFPKTFSRLVRFNALVKFVETQININWSLLAEAFGYYDQSHFIHEFKTFTGHLPQSYFNHKTNFEKILSS